MSTRRQRRPLCSVIFLALWSIGSPDCSSFHKLPVDWFSFSPVVTSVAPSGTRSDQRNAAGVPLAGRNASIHSGHCNGEDYTSFMIMLMYENDYYKHVLSV